MANAIHLMTVGRRATLSELLNTKKDEALNKLATAKNYDSSMRKSGLQKLEVGFHDEILLMGVCSIAEIFLTDITSEFLVCFPGGLESKQFSLESLASRGSASSLLREVAEIEINSISYKPFPEMLQRLQNIFNFKQPLNEKLVGEFNEIKCTRDVYVHGNGKANRLYIRKAGNMARAKLNDDLPLGESYISAAIDKSEELINKFFSAGPANYLKFGKVRAFREMWEASFLNMVMPFDCAWKGGGSIVRPTQKAIGWGWSSSEKALFDFFLGIFNFSHKELTSGLVETLGRFPPSTPEGQIIISWLDSPFYF